MKKSRITLGAAALGGLSTLALGLAAQQTPTPYVDEAASLFVRDVGVVDDLRASGGGEWSFGHLIEQMSGSVPPSRFAEAWISSLTDTPQVNLDPVMTWSNVTSAREVAYDDFFDAWRARSAGGVLDLNTAPFRLIAIVNRPDLLEVDGGVVESAGECRFVYAAVDPADADPRTAALAGGKFFVIFEYGVPASSCEDVVAWHQRWQDLAVHPLGSPAYNDALAAITRDVVDADETHPGVNGSKLNQLRTNTFDLGALDLFWDLREWTLQSASGSPQHGTLTTSITQQTPSFRYLRQARIGDLAAWLSDPVNRAAVLAGEHEVGRFLSSSSPLRFAGGLAVNASEAQGVLPPDFDEAGGSGTFWWAPGFASNSNAMQIVSEENAQVRHGFALQTCSGCHFHESGGTTFSMTTAREFGSETNLHGFLTGTGAFLDPVNPVVERTTVDPSTGATTVEQVTFAHSFSDLARRRDVMARVLQLDCTASGLTSELEQIDASSGTRVH